MNTIYIIYQHIPGDYHTPRKTLFYDFAISEREAKRKCEIYTEMHSNTVGVYKNNYQFSYSKELKAIQSVKYLHQVYFYISGYHKNLYSPECLIDVKRFYEEKEFAPSVHFLPPSRAIGNQIDKGYVKLYYDEANEDKAIQEARNLLLEELERTNWDLKW